MAKVKEQTIHAEIPGLGEAVIFGNPDKSIQGSTLYLTDDGKKLVKDHRFDKKKLTKISLLDRHYQEDHSIQKGQKSASIFLKTDAHGADEKELYHDGKEQIPVKNIWGVRIFDDDGQFVDIPMDTLSTQKPEPKKRVIKTKAPVVSEPNESPADTLKKIADQDDTVFVGSSNPTDPQTPTKERPKVITAVGTKAKERRIFDLVHERFEKTAGWWMKTFKEVFEEKLWQFYDRALEAAQTPFAKESIARAEQMAKKEYQDRLQGMNGVSRAATRFWNWTKEKTFGTTWTQERTIELLKTSQDDALQQLISQERQGFSQELDSFSDRFALQFDQSAQTLIKEGIVRSGMGEQLLEADQPTKDRIHSIIKDYYTNSGNLDQQHLDERLQTELTTLFTELKTQQPGVFKDTESLAGNIALVAKDMKRQLEVASNHTEGLTALDRELATMNVRLGVGLMGEATELRPTETRRWVKRIKTALNWMEKKNIVTGLMVNDAVVGTAVSAGLALWWLPRSVISRSARMWGGAAAGGLVTAVISGSREYGRRKGELLRVYGQKEAGIVTPAGLKMREWYDRFDMKPRSVNQLVTGMTAGIYEADGTTLRADISENDLRMSLGNLADAKARRIVSSREQNRIGLINIGGVGEQEANRTRLEQAIIKAEKDLITYMDAHQTNTAVTSVLHGSAATTYINTLTNAQTRILTEGSTALQQITSANPSIGLTLGKVTEFMPETDVMRHRFLLWGKETAKGKVSGVDDILSEFKKEAATEATKYGLYRGAIGVGVGSLVNQAIMSGTGHGESGAILSALRHLGITGGSEHDVLSPVSSGITMISGHPVQLGNNLTLDTSGNLDYVDATGTLHNDVVTDFSHHISFDAQGHMAIDSYVASQLEHEGLITGLDYTDFPAPITGGPTHMLGIGGQQITAPQALHFGTLQRDGTADLLYSLKDADGHTTDLVIQQHVAMGTDGTFDDSVIDTIKSRTDLFSFSGGSADVETPMGTTIDLVNHEMLDGDGIAHAPEWTLPEGYAFREDGTNLFSIVDTNTSAVLASGVQTDEYGHIVNLSDVHNQLDAASDTTHWDIRESTDAFQIEKEGVLPDSYRDIHFLNQNYLATPPGSPAPDEVFGIAEKPGGMWEFFTHETTTPQGTNAVKHALRSWMLYYGENGEGTTPSGERILTYDSIKGMEGLAREIPHEQTVLGTEIHWEALQNNAHIKLTNLLFSDENISQMDQLTNQAIADYAHNVAGITATDHDTIMDQLGSYFSTHGIDRAAIESSFGDDKVGWILFKMGYIGKEADLPTKDELGIIMEALNGGGGEIQDVTQYNYEFIETVTGANGIITPLPATIAQSIFTVGDEIQSFIPILPPEFAKRLEAVETLQNLTIRLPKLPEIGNQYPNIETLDSLQEWIHQHPEKHHPYKRIQNSDGTFTWVDENNQPVKRDIGREKMYIQTYLNQIKQTDPEYYTYLESLLNESTLSEMTNENRVSVMIPSWMEGSIIYNTLERYIHQVDNDGNPLSSDLFEINIIINRKRGSTSDNTVSEIQRFIANSEARGEHYHINFIDVEFDPPYNNVGHARKVITDLTLLRSIRRSNQQSPLYIESEDADLENVDLHTIINLIEKLDNNPELDAAAGIQDRNPDIMMQNDYLFLGYRLDEFAGQTLQRDKKYRLGNNPNWSSYWNRIITGGWNTGYTAEAYAMIGGGDSLKSQGEDTVIGQKISMCRGDKINPNIDVIGKTSTRSDSSPRRFIEAILTGKGAYGEGFVNEELNKKIKTLTIPELLSQINDVSRINSFNRDIFVGMIAWHYDFLKQFAPSIEVAQEDFKKILYFAGFQPTDYQFLPDGTIQISSLDNVQKALEDYRTRHSRLRNPGERASWRTA